MKKIILLLGLTFILFANLKAQNYYFTDTLFIQELGQFMEPIYKVHPEAEDAYNKLAENWESGNLDNYKFGIIYVANSMRESYVKAYPDFLNYILTLNALFEKNDMEYYSEWEVGLMGVVLSKKSNFIREYLGFSKLLVIDSILVQTPAVTWKANSTDYVIGNDPESQTLYINFNNEIDLMCYNTKGNVIDTFIIEQTSGTCYPTKEKWEGDKGKVTWQQAGLDPNKVFARFDRYELDMKQSKFVVEEAIFTNEDLQLYKIPGKLEVKLLQTKNKNNRPTFESDEKMFIKNIFNEVDFHGYFKMEGDKLLGTGKEGKASVFIKDNGISQATIKSNEFQIEPDISITSASSNVSFYTNNKMDSIWQYNLNVRYENRLDSSLYNPKWFKFDMNNGDFLILSRTSSGMGRTPFSDTYHNLNIYADRLIWKKSDSLLYMVTTRGSELDYVMFESTDYFNEKDYEYFAFSRDKINHLAEIKVLYKKFYDQGYEKGMTPEAYENHIKSIYSDKRIDATKLFQQLSYAGFIYYNRDKNYAIPNEKLFRYVSNSARKKLKKKEIKKDGEIYFQDYDKLMIISMKGETGVRLSNVGTNATINLINNTLNIKNVKPFNLAPTVKIYADELNVQQDRNINFGGSVGAGLTQITGTKFFFDYDSYKIEVRDDESQMKMWTKDTVGYDIVYNPVSTKIQGVQGTIFINEHDNKSNTVKSDSFPILKTNQNAKIYYEEFASKYWTDSDTTKGKTFNEMFYFEAYNFNLDSLDNMTDSTLKYEGKMHTGLFEPLDVTLTVKTNPKDGSKSLGFTECTDANEEIKSGLEFKGGKFFGCFTLNDAGLFGDGFILYSSSYVHSSEFAFMPNEVIASIDTFSIDPAQGLKEGHKEDIPFVYGQDVFFNWEDNMLFTKDEKKAKPKMIFYSDKLETPGNLLGNVTYTNNEVTGAGTFVFDDANIIDTTFAFKASSFSAQTCDFDLKVGKTTAFKTRNLNGNVDIDEKLGSFYSNDDTSSIFFPENNYMCIMDHFLWKIGEGIVNIGGVMPGKDTTDYVNSLEEKVAAKKDNKDIKLYGTILVGTADTLSFNAATTTYELETKTVSAENVQEIKIADAMIYPKGTVTINKGGHIDTLLNINFDYPYNLFSPEKSSNYLHSFEGANIYIENRFSYKAAMPTYYYQHNMQPIIFSSVIVENAPKHKPYDKNVVIKDYDLHSLGTRSMRFGDSIILSDNFIFEGQGKIKIYAQEEFPEFEGYAKFDTTCSAEKAPIYEFKLTPTIIDHDSVVMPMPGTVDGRSGKILHTGLFWETTRIDNKSTYGIKRAFVDRIDSESEIIFGANGVIYYHPKTGEYRIGPPEKVRVQYPDSLWGNMMSFNKNLCIVKAQGEFRFFQNWDVKDKKKIEHIASTFRGYYRCDLEQDVHNFQGAWSLDFIAPKIILDDIADKIVLGDANESILDDQERMTKNYYAFLGKPKTDEIFEQIVNDFGYNMPDELKHTIMFSDINLTWSPDSSSLVSNGKLGIASINGKKVDRYINGYVKYRNTKKIRMFLIILEPIEGILYAFKYRYADGRGVMKIYTKTGNTDVDNYFDGLKDKDKSFKDNYYINKTTETEFKAFAKEYIKRK